MKFQLGIAALLLVPVGAALARTTQTPQDKKATPAVAPKDDPSMMKMKEFATPGPSHKTLEMKVGKWSAEMKMFKPNGDAFPPSKGTSEIKSMLDGRFVAETYTGDFMGQPFHGEGRFGFDNLKKKYISTWLDDAGTGIYAMEGTFDAGSKTFTFTGDMPDTDAGKYVKSRMVEKWTDNDHFTVQSFSPGTDGKEFMGMELRYTRAK